MVDKSDIPRGTWVQVWGQVFSLTSHPEDVVVEFFSHNEQYKCNVRLDRIQVSDDTPDFVEQCRAMQLSGNNVYVRCERHDRHPDVHKSGDIEWPNIYTDGFFEES